MKKNFLTFLVFMALCATSYAEALSLNQILEATCRIGTPNQYGSGTVVAEQRDSYFILTNAHVTGDSDDVTVEFFTQGAKTLPIKGKVEWKAHYRRTDVDFALVSIPTSSLRTWKPRIIPLANRNYSIVTNTYVQSAGCPEARWPMAWEGRVTVDAGSRILFTPPPTGGQSGSALLVNVPDSKGNLHTRVGGVVTWRIGTSGRAINGYDFAAGGAIPVQRLYDALDGNIKIPKKVPESYSLIGTASIERSNLEKALGSDGKYYEVVIEDGQKVAENLPLGVRVLRWPDVEVREPANPLVPAPIIGNGLGGYGNAGGYGYAEGYSFSNGRNSTYYNPYGGYGGYAYDYSDDGEIDELRNRIEAQEEQIQLLTQQRDSLQSEKINLEKFLADRTRELESLSSDLESLKQSAQSDKNQIQELSNTITIREKEISNLTVVLQNKEKQLTEITSRITDLESKAEDKVDEVSMQRNILGGISGLGVLSFIGWLVWSQYGKKKIGDTLDKVEDRVQDRIEPIIGENFADKLREAIDSLEQRIGDRIDNRLGGNTSIDGKLGLILNFLKDVLASKLGGDGDSPTPEETKVKDNPFQHPDFIAPPPGPVYSEPQQGTTVRPSPPRIRGLGPVVPEYPAHKYTSHEILEAVEEVSRMGPALRNVTSLVQQVLKAPKRLRTERE